MQNDTPPQGPQAEVNTAKPVNQPGVYEHPVTKKRLIAMPDAQSTAVSDALVRVGFVRVADAPSRADLQKAQDDQRAKDMKAEKEGRATGVQEDLPVEKVNGTATDPGVDAATHQAVVAENEELKAKLAGSDKPAPRSRTTKVQVPGSEEEAEVVTDPEASAEPAQPTNEEETN